MDHLAELEKRVRVLVSSAQEREKKLICLAKDNDQLREENALLSACLKEQEQKANQLSCEKDETKHVINDLLGMLSSIEGQAPSKEVW